MLPEIPISKGGQAMVSSTRVWVALVLVFLSLDQEAEPKSLGSPVDLTPYLQRQENREAAPDGFQLGTLPRIRAHALRCGAIDFFPGIELSFPSLTRRVSRKVMVRASETLALRLLNTWNRR